MLAHRPPTAPWRGRYYWYNLFYRQGIWDTKARGRGSAGRGPCRWHKAGTHRPTAPGSAAHTCEVQGWDQVGCAGVGIFLPLWPADLALSLLLSVTCPCLCPGIVSFKVTTAVIPRGTAPGYLSVSGFLIPDLTFALQAQRAPTGWGVVWRLSGPLSIC